MAQKFVSPGVFTEELDQSFLAQGVGDIGAVVIGMTQKGPAFVPTKVGNFQEFVDNFGDMTAGNQLPYAAKNYLKNAGTLTVVRVLGDANDTGVTNGSPNMTCYSLYASSTTGFVHLGLLFGSGSVFLSGAGSTVYLTSSASTVTASLNPSLNSNWSKTFNTDPTKFASKGYFLYETAEWNAALASLTNFTGVLVTASTNFRSDYTNSRSSMIQSQYFGNVIYDLFEVYTRADGAASTGTFKVSISNIKPSLAPDSTRYGTFDISVRLFGDTDQRPQVVETFTACTLDPDSQNYVARLVGDQYEIWNSVKAKFEVTGTFQKRSKHIRLKMVENSGAPPEALPFGHAAYYWTAAASPTVNSGSIPFILNQTNDQGNLDNSIHWGHDLTWKNGALDSMKFLPAGVLASTGTLITFNLGRLISGTYQNKTTWSYGPWVSSSYTDPVAVSSSVFKFTVPLKGGFDGFDITSATPLSTNDSDGDSVAQVVWLKKGISVVANPDQYDINLMSLPGITNYKVNDWGRQVCNDRADALFIMDIPGASVNDTISKMNNRAIDDNYTAAYYPDVKYNDRVNNRVATVKPSVAVLGAIAYNDRIGAPHFAPAGLNRGGLAQFDIVDVADRLTYSERNDLYDARINPIASFPQEGLVIFGQKTLQVKPSALDRINVRRLLIYSKKLVASAAKYLLFEPNNPNTWQRFLNTVNPILDEIRQNRGIERFKVVMDSTVNTPDLIDRNIMKGKIFLQPTRAAEFIDLSFIITSSGVSFEE